MQRTWAALLSAVLLLGLTACADTSSRAAQTSHLGTSSAADSSQADTVAVFDFNGVAVPVETLPEMEITELAVSADWAITFRYSVGNLRGEARIFPSHQTYFRVDLSAMALRFQRRDGTICLEVEWQDKWEDPTQTQSTKDVFMLDESLNLWIYLLEGSLLYPTELTKEQAKQLFPEEELTEFSFVLLLCYEPLYDVNIYRVTDMDRNLEEDVVLLAHYDTYEPKDCFLWQSDIMYKWHLSIEYTDGERRTYMVGYAISNNNAAWVMEEPDWKPE